MKTLTKALLAALCVSFLALPAAGEAATVKKPQTIEAQQTQKKATKKVAVKKKSTQQAAKKQTKVAKASKKTTKYQNQ